MKNTCKKIIKLSAVLALAGMPAAVMADTISLQLDPTLDTTVFTIPVGGGVNEQGYGGPFDATVTYDNGSTSKFITFCVQTEVDIDTGTTYSYTLSQTESPNQALTLGTAYLYYSFLNGSLGSLLTGSTAYGELQAAIWTLQGQIYTYPFDTGSTSDPTDPLSNPFLTYAEGEVGNGTLAGLENPSDGAYGVDIMNIAGAQNQLMEVPDACSTALLLGAVLPIGFILRKKLGMVAAKN
jgi:hypothetical protein